MKSNKLPYSKMNSHQVAGVGRSFVESELRKRGATSVTFIGKQKIYLQVSNSDQNRTVQIQVKTKRGKGNWHSRTDEAEEIKTPPNPEDIRKFWVFVDLSGSHKYWIVPDWWIRNNIFEAHREYTNKYGGGRAKNDSSNHHSIDEKRLTEWQDRWEILNIFE